MPKSSSVRLKDLKDLGKYFKATDNKVIKDEIPSKDYSSQILKKRNKLIESALIHEDKKIRISFHKNFKSVCCSEEKFNNHLKSYNCIESSKVKKLLDLESTNCDRQKIPFKLDEDTLDIYQRHINIMNVSGVYNGERDGEISKATYLGEVTRDLCYGQKTNEPTRIFFKYRDNNIKILLIDLYHLFATNNKNEIENKYKDVAGYNINIIELRKNR